jgi:hypothetical protein
MDSGHRPFLRLLVFLVCEFLSFFPIKCAQQGGCATIPSYGADQGAFIAGI